MNLDHVRYLLAVEKYGSITKASQRLFLSQPNVSKAIRTLEEDLGIKILTRSSSGSLLTREGLEFLKEVRPLIERWDFLSSKYVLECPAQTLHIVAFASSMLEVTLFKTMQETGQKIVMSQKNFAEIMESLKTGSAQYAFLYLTKEVRSPLVKLFEEEEIHIEKVLDDHFYIIISKSNPLDVSNLKEQLKNFTCVLYSNILAPDLLDLVQIMKDLIEDQESIIHVTDRTSEYLALGLLPNTFSITTKLPSSILEMYQLRQIPLLEYPVSFLLLYKKNMDPLIQTLMDRFCLSMQQDPLK